ncbi:MAG: S8 family serine peptidase [Vicinamibacterales bacterium]|nr:S8 family serine peptidase [Vicinamibacterales bacterium]
MSVTRRFMRHGALVAAALAVALIAGPRASAQQAGIDPPPFRWSAERMAAMAAAFRDDLDHIPGEVLVKFRPGMGPAAQASALSVLRGDMPASDQHWLGDLLLVRAPGEPDVEQMAARLAAQPEVEYAHPNYLSRTQQAVTPNDPFFNQQWNFNAINMPLAWEINPGGSPSVTVAVIDTGATQAAETFNFQLWTGSRFETLPIPYGVNPDFNVTQMLPGRDFVFFTAGTPVLDMVGHGTHVAGTIVQATNNNLGLAGIAYQSRFLPLKACFGYWEVQIVQSFNNIPGFVPPSNMGGCPTSAVVEAIRYAADQGAHVINLSLGGFNAVPAYQDALQYAVGRGAFVAISAGNDFESGNRRSYPASYAASLDGAMSVAALGNTNARAYYSNTGDYVEIAAPGGNTRQGSAALIYQASLSFADLNPSTVIIPRFDRYVVSPSQGTSMASPHVAGLAALLHSQGITSPAAKEAAIKRFARDLGTAGRNNEYGHGLIDARATLRGLGLAR